MMEMVMGKLRSQASVDPDFSPAEFDKEAAAAPCPRHPYGV